jgi:hypothetical protein
VNRCHFCGLFCLFVDAVVHYAEDELDDHCDYYDDAKHLMARVKFLALRRVLAQSSGFLRGLTLLYNVPIYIPIAAPTMPNIEAKVWLMPCILVHPNTRRIKVPRGMRPTNVKTMIQAKIPVSR